MKKLAVLLISVGFLAAIGFPQVPDDTPTPLKTYSESTTYQPREFPETRYKEPKTKKRKAGEGDIIPRSISIPVTVADSQGYLISDLKRSDFQVFVDDVEIADFNVENENKPLRLAIMLDTSSSNTKDFGEFQRFIESLVENLEPQDEVMIAEFHHRFRVRSKFTTDREAIYKSIRKLQPGGGTSIYDAIRGIFKEDLDDPDRRTAIIVISDGVDSTSEDSDYEKSLRIAEEYDIPIFVIYVDTYKNLPPKNNNYRPDSVQWNILMRSASRFTQKNYETGKNYLADLVSLSGGRVSLFEKIVADPKGVTLPRFSDELRVKYFIKFDQPDNAEIGLRKKVRIRVKRPNLILLAKGSYITK